MINNARVGENQTIHSQLYLCSTVAAMTTSHGYPVDDCSDVCFLINVGVNVSAVSSLAGVINDLLSTITVLQSGDKNMATNAGLSTATLNVNIGTTAANRVDRVQSAYINFSTVDTDNATATIQINGITLTKLTTFAANGTNFNSTGGFGSSVSSTVAEGLELSGAGLANLINSTFGSSVYNGGLGSVFRAVTISTQTVRVDCIDTMQLTSGLTIVTTGNGFRPHIGQQQVKLEFKTDELNSTSKFVALSISSVATSLQMSITCIKSGVRYQPKFFGNSKIST